MRDLIDLLGRDSVGAPVDFLELTSEMPAIRRMESEERSARKYSIPTLSDGVE